MLICGSWDVQHQADIVCYLQVKHSRTKFASYAKDFQNLVDLYSDTRKASGKKLAVNSRESEEQTDFSYHDAENIHEPDYDDDEEDPEDSLANKNSSNVKGMSEEYLEDETDILERVDDWDGMLLTLSEYADNRIKFLNEILYWVFSILLVLRNGGLDQIWSCSCLWRVLRNVSLWNHGYVCSFRKADTWWIWTEI